MLRVAACLKRARRTESARGPHPNPAAHPDGTLPSLPMTWGQAHWTKEAAGTAPNDPFLNNLLQPSFHCPCVSLPSRGPSIHAAPLSAALTPRPWSSAGWLGSCWPGPQLSARLLLWLLGSSGDSALHLHRESGQSPCPFKTTGGYLWAQTEGVSKDPSPFPGELYHPLLEHMQ